MSDFIKVYMMCGWGMSKKKSSHNFYMMCGWGMS